jgi:hypothetical protein
MIVNAAYISAVTVSVASGLCGKLMRFRTDNQSLEHLANKHTN